MHLVATLYGTMQTILARTHIMKLLNLQFSAIACYFLPLSPNYIP